jgi:hypothetical protein
MTTTHEMDPVAGHLVQFILASLPIFSLLVYFLWLAYLRPFEDAASRSDFILAETDLEDMVVVFLVIAQLWGILAVYLSSFVPLRHRLLQSYLTEGRSTLGDVFYEERSSVCCPKQHRGHVIYPHPNKDIYPVFVRRKLPVIERYTRERVTILVLPELPFSGQGT